MPTETTKAGKWSYSGNPNESARDQLRFLIGDTDPDDPLILDGECDFLLSQYNNTPLNAAVRACETLLTKFSRMVDESVGPVKISFSQRIDNMEKVQTTLLARLAREDAQPYAGGISVSDKHTNDQNRDRVRPDFSKHMMENLLIAPWITTQNYWAFLNYLD